MRVVLAAAWITRAILRPVGMALFVASAVTGALSLLESIPDLAAVAGLAGMLVGRGMIQLGR
jgi:hypothetical protein